MTKHASLRIGLLVLLAACAGGAGGAHDTGASESSGAADSAAPIACTMIGCEDQTVLRLENAPMGPFRVEIEVPGATGDAARRTFECPAGQRCTDVLFPGLVAERATARVIAGGDTTVHELEPTVRTEYPNGPQCPPGCRIGRDTISLQGGS